MTLPHHQTVTHDIDPLAMWAGELEGLHPDSHAYKETLGALMMLAAESGADMSNLSGVGGEEEAAPSGFTRSEKLATPAVLPADQFDGTIVPLKGEGSHFVDVFELTSDTGQVIRVCDLRGKTNATLKNVQPATAAEQERADQAFWRDIKVFADTGTPRNTVAGTPGVFYTKVGGTKIRAYWLPVKDETNSAGVRTVARVGDCGNGTNNQKSLYRKLFGRDM